MVSAGDDGHLHHHRAHDRLGRRAAGVTALRARALGDGKTYVLKVETGQPWSYIQRFDTEAGVRRTYDLPVGGFQPVNRFLDPVAARRLWPLRASAGWGSTSSINSKARSNSLSVPSTLQAEDSARGEGSEVSSNCHAQSRFRAC